MTVLKDQLLQKLEKLSDSDLQKVLDFASFLEWQRQNQNQEQTLRLPEVLENLSQKPVNGLKNVEGVLVIKSSAFPEKMINLQETLLLLKSPPINSNRCG